jgi:hypothetical protein
MPTSERHFAPGLLQFLTSSTYRRAKVFESERFRWSFVEVLGQHRTEVGFLLIGGVLMPDHFHLLILPLLLWAGEVALARHLSLVTALLAMVELPVLLPR